MQKAIEKLLTVEPNLKAREIARKTGFERKEVSAFLHRHNDVFMQDEDFRWSLAELTGQILTLASSWVDETSFEQCLANSGGLFNSPSVTVKLPKGCKILLVASARLLALLNQLAHFRKKVTVDLTDCSETESFLSRSGFFDCLDKRVNVIPDRPTLSAAKIFKGNNSALVEFGQIDPKVENKELVKRLTHAFVQQSCQQYEVAAFTVFGELIGNVKEHSESPIQGFAALQKYKGKRKHIQTVVSDSGLGIATTLRPSLRSFYPELYRSFNEQSLESDAGLVQTVLSKGEISRFGVGRGLGFKSSRAQAMKFDAELSVRQEIFSLRLKYTGGVLVEVAKSQLPLQKILGTHICFDFFVDPT